jgi:hypothetical protein
MLRPAFFREILIGLTVLVALGGGAAAAWWYWLRPKPDEREQATSSKVRAAETIQVPVCLFRDVTKASGIDFRHINGSNNEKLKLLPETMGSGVAVFDYNGDGLQDILFINSCWWPGMEESSQPPPTLKLYRNKGKYQFEDVTAACGLAITMYGMGVTVGDYDNDGWPDIFITGVGGNRLFHNEDDGKGNRIFKDVTATAGVGGPGGWPAMPSGPFKDWKEPINWSSSATWLDYDGDGKLDLFVCNYIDWSPAKDRSQGFKYNGRDRGFGPPKNFDGAMCFLYRNLGDGRFEDVTLSAGIPVYNPLARPEEVYQAPLPFVGPFAILAPDLFSKPIGKSLAVVATDLDGDGYPDIIVANDTVRNFLFHNVPDGKGGRRFVEMAETANIAYAEGQARGAMGLDYGEIRPGQSAALITNFADEPSTFALLEKRQALRFSDIAVAEGISGPSKLLLKFGCFLFDYDLDGRLDMLTSNGHLEPEINTVAGGQTYRQPVQVFWNTGGRTPDGKRCRCYEPAKAEQLGKDIFEPLVGRGCAYGSFGDKGLLDVVLVENGGHARLLRNECANGNHWIRVTLEGDGKRSNKSAIGARVTLKAGDVTMTREVLSGRGYLSQSELPVNFGLGKLTKIDSVTVRWPGKDGGEELFTDFVVDKPKTLIQGKGTAK